MSDGSDAKCRVYVHNLPWKMTSEEFATLMAEVGTVRSASIMIGRDGRSRGCGLAEYATEAEAQTAIATLTDREVDGRKILVREDREVAGAEPRARPAARARPAREAPVAVAAPAAAAGAAHADRAASFSVIVSNLPWSVGWKELKEAFAAYSPVYSNIFKVRGSDKSTGRGILRFSTPEAAQSAIDEMNGVDMGGRTISVAHDRLASPSA